MFRRNTAPPSEPAAIDAGQSETKVKELRDALGPLFGRNILFCTDACLRRYLVARNWSLEKAKNMLEETLKWRASFKPEDIQWSDTSKEGETGKVFRANFRDRFGRTVLIMRPGKQNTKDADGQVRFLVYNLENAIFNLPETEEQMVWLIDFTGWSIYCANMKASRDFMNILQSHYPERLGAGFVYNPPRIFQAFFKIIKYVIDPHTFLKIKFVYPSCGDSAEVMKSYFDMESLPSEFGGMGAMSFDLEELSLRMAQDDVKRAAYWAGSAVPPVPTPAAP